MSWFRIDDTFGDHPKVMTIPRKQRRAVVGLWTLAGTWCARHLTDGHMPTLMLDEIGGTKAEAAMLVAVGLWEAAPDGWQFHDWRDWQPTREEVLADRAASAERQKKWREKRRAEREKQANGDTGNGVTDTSPEPDATDDVTPFVTPLLTGDSAVSHGVSNAAPTRPDPTRPDPTAVPSELQSQPPSRRSARKPPPSPATPPAAAVVENGDPPTLDIAPPAPPPPSPNPVQALVAAYADRVPGTPSRSLLGAIGRAVKRLIETDHLDPALIFAAIQEAAPTGRRDLDRIIAAPGLARRWNHHDERQRMFAAWADNARRLDGKAAS